MPARTVSGEPVTAAAAHRRHEGLCLRGSFSACSASSTGGNGPGSFWVRRRIAHSSRLLDRRSASSSVSAHITPIAIIAFGSGWSADGWKWAR